MTSKRCGFLGRGPLISLGSA